jgi:NAD dependent epimerase/dehydratase family enzyme
VTNRQFTRALGKALHRPAVLAVPAAVLRMAVGEMADEMLLSSARVVPQALEKHGFQFSHPDFGTALASLFA